MSTGMPWVKFFVEDIDDPRLGRLTLARQLLYYKMRILAGDCDKEGYLIVGGQPLTAHDIAWRLHLDTSTIDADLESLQGTGAPNWDEKGLEPPLIVLHDGAYLLTDFSERQRRPQREQRNKWRERQRRYRARLRSNDEGCKSLDGHAVTSPLVTVLEGEGEGEEEEKEEKSRSREKKRRPQPPVGYEQLEITWTDAVKEPPNSLDREELWGLAQKFGSDTVIRAIKEANRSRTKPGQINVNFVRAILERWGREGEVPKGKPISKGSAWIPNESDHAADVREYLAEHGVVIDG